MGLMLSLTFMLTISCLFGGYSYNLKCPESPHRTFRAVKCPKTTNSNYQCLFGEDNVYIKEFCKGEEIAREGFKYVLHPNPQQVDCSPTRYQPFTFTSHEQSYCIYKKSLCNDEGQIVVFDGSTKSDRQCRCDYTRGYMFVSPPKNKCFCSPTVEDCSCYYNACTGDNQIMLPDYRCVSRGNEPLPESILCPSITRTRTTPSQELQPTSYRDRAAPGEEKMTSLIVTVLFCLLLVTVVLVLLVIVICSAGFIYTELLSGVNFSPKDAQGRYTVLTGDQITFRCTIECCLPVKSVTWQRNGVNIEEKFYNLDKTTNISELTLENIMVDSSGIYTCVVEYCLRLKSTHLSNRYSFLSRFPFFKDVVQNLPESITINVVAINNEEQTEHKFTFYKGKDVTLRFPSVRDEDIKTLVRIKSDGTLSLKNNSRGNRSSWTIQNCCKQDSGLYLCLRSTPEGIMFENPPLLARLNVIEEDETLRDIEEHRKDSLYVETVEVQMILESFKRTRMVIVSGREGCGKSKLCLEVSSQLENQGVRPVKIDENLIGSVQFSDQNTLYLIDNVKVGTLRYLKELKILSQNNSSIKILVTCRKLQLSVYKKICNDNLPFELFDLDVSFEIEDRKLILKRYMAENNIIEVTDKENYRDLEVINDGDIALTIDNGTIIKILNSDPWFGFPLSVYLFCIYRKNVYFGEHFFTNPPKSKADQAKILYKKAQNGGTFENVNQFFILAYIFINDKHKLRFSNLEDYCFGGILHSFNINTTDIINLESVKDATDCMFDEWLYYNVDGYTFNNPLVSLAVLYANPDVACNVLIQQGSLDDICRIIRQDLFTDLDNGSVIEIDKKFIDPLCERLVKECCRDTNKVEKISQYIYKWIAKRHVLFKESILQCIDRYRYQQHDERSMVIPDQQLSRVESMGRQPISIESTISLIDGMMNQGKDNWIFENTRKVPDYILLCSMVLAVKEDYINEKEDAFYALLAHLNGKLFSEFNEKLNDKGDTFKGLIQQFGQKSPKTLKIIIESLPQGFDLLQTDSVF